MFCMVFLGKSREKIRENVPPYLICNCTHVLFLCSSSEFNSKMSNLKGKIWGCVLESILYTVERESPTIISPDLHYFLLSSRKCRDVWYHLRITCVRKYNSRPRRKSNSLFCGIELGHITNRNWKTLGAWLIFLLWPLFGTRPFVLSSIKTKCFSPKALRTSSDVCNLTRLLEGRRVLASDIIHSSRSNFILPTTTIMICMQIA